MGRNSAIAWTDHTWNPWQGCRKISPACDNCYMYHEKKRYGQDPAVVKRSSNRTFCFPYSLLKEPAKVFVCSWSDFFIKEADEWRNQAWEIIRTTPHLTYQILTKRPKLIPARLPLNWGAGWPNVWLGVTVENNDYRYRIIDLLRIPARVHFISYEPALGPLDLSPFQEYLGKELNWIICGGESGPKARPVHPDWVRNIRDQCQASGTPFFFKQWGLWYPFRDNGPLPPNCRYVGFDGTVRIGDPEDMDHDVCMGKDHKKLPPILDGQEWRQFPEVST